MEKIERRFTASPFEYRAKGDDDSRHIGGIAALVGVRTVLMESEWNGKKEKYIEYIKPGAFDDVMKDDVRSLVNHNSEKILGRTTAGTLSISLNSQGHLEYDVPDVPDTTYGNDLLVSVKRNDINQSSFAFRVGESLRQVEEDETEVRYIREIVKFSNLFDVSPVTYPAYEETVTEMRGEMERNIDQVRKEFRGKEKDEPDDDLALKIAIQQQQMRFKILP